jgi:2-oxoglutarate dehydrogenase E1 component
MKRTFRKPLICMTPKSLLRSATSTLEDFTQRGFQLVIDDPAEPNPQRVRRVLLCSGKVYYTLNEARKKKEVNDVALVRVEQFYPFPEKEIKAILVKYRLASEIAWVQDEPENRGAWRFMDAKLRNFLPEDRVLSYIGREEAASPATGLHKMHDIEEEELVSHALDLPPREVAPHEAASVPVSGTTAGAAMATANKQTAV